MARLAVEKQRRQLLEMADMWERLAQSLDAAAPGAPVHPAGARADKPRG